MNGFETILFEKKDNIAYVTLNRPEVLNVYSVMMRDELYQVLGAIKDDDDIRVMVLKASGERAFCAGADLSEFLTAPSPVIARQVRWERDVWGLFLSVPQPIIAALNGYVLGSGLEMALCCDLRIASEDAQFGLPEVRLGIIPAAGATQTLPRAVGRARALDMLLSGIWFNAKEAHRAKLVNRVVSRDKLLPTIDRVAEKIASYNPIMVRIAKQALMRGRELPLAEALIMERRLSISVRQCT
ncbi:enoyl-CoA hydratase/isomerase family protein [Chloroflexota bacterium]